MKGIGAICTNLAIVWGPTFQHGFCLPFRDSKSARRKKRSACQAGKPQIRLDEESGVPKSYSCGPLPVISTELTPFIECKNPLITSYN